MSQSKHDKKMALKRQIKAQRRALYTSLAGTSKKKKRQKAGKYPTTMRKAHAMADCGNPGCKKCYPHLNVGSFGGKTHIAI